MAGPAQVRSIAAVEEFRAALAKFELAVQDALEGLEGQIRRGAEWIEHDRPAFWRQQMRDAEDAIHQAKIELERCLTFTVADHRPACREERAALKAAQNRLQYCRDKGAAVRDWRRRLQQETFEYHGRIGQLRQLLEIDLPRARHALALTLQRLEAYRLERPPEALDPTLVRPADDVDRPPPGTPGT